MDIWWIVAVAVAVVLASVLWLRLHAFLALIMAGFLVALLTPQAALQQYAEQMQDASRGGTWSSVQAQAFLSSSPPERLAKAIGEYGEKIGILIAMASVIGAGLLHSGAAMVIIRHALAVVGPSGASYALMGGSFLLGIPVFFDTVFFLMIPLAKSLRRQLGKDYVLFILSILAGGSLAHSLVPPTPGPLFVAAELKIDVLHMMIAGLCICACSSVVSLGAARVINRWTNVPLRDEAGQDEAGQDLVGQNEADAAGGRVGDFDRAGGPPLILCLTPIILPLLLISGSTIWSLLLKGSPPWESQPWVESVDRLFGVIFNKNVALGISAAIAMGLLRWAPASVDRRDVIGKAIASGGVIILITCAGGAFGMMLRFAGIEQAVVSMTGQLPGLALLPIAFVVTASIRTLQGSATVAMITAAGVLQGFADSSALPFHPVYIATAIGAGSKPIAWMTDSGFWVMCKMSGMTESEGLKTVTPMSIAMGLIALFFTMLGAWLLPMTPTGT